MKLSVRKILTPNFRRKKYQTDDRSQSNASHQPNKSINEPITNSDAPTKIDLNAATEEELMTLPHVNRDVARRIVQHRRTVAPFKNVHELKHIFGLDMRKIHDFEAEVHVKNERESNPANILANSNIRLNVNDANIFDLQSIGMTKTQAINLINHRKDRKIDTLEQIEAFSSKDVKKFDKFLTFGDEHDSKKSYQTHCRRSTMNDIFDLLSMFSARPSVPEFNFKRNNRRVVRLVTWNLDGFNSDKAGNPGVVEVICRTILENGLSIICLQQVTETTALKRICDELNEPTLKKIIEWRQRHPWSCNFKYLRSNWYSEPIKIVPCTACIYDTNNPDYAISNRKIIMSKIKSADFSAINACDLDYLFVSFRFKRFDVNLCNVFVRSRGNFERFARALGSVNNLMLFGDFQYLRECGELFETLRATIPFDTNTSTNDGIVANDNILTSAEIQDIRTNAGGLIRDGLTHLAIPNGWTWGGYVSKHCPVWFEIYSD